MPYQYQAYGISVVSDIELPALLGIEGELDTKSIFVTQGVVNDALQNIPFGQNALSTFNDHEFRHEIPNVAKYYVANGKQVIVEPLCNNWDEILLYFYSNCMAAILFQRNMIPFHVSGVFVDKNKVLLFAAPSRTGKSTTALMLQQARLRSFYG